MSKFYVDLLHVLCIVFIFNSVVDCCSRKKETKKEILPTTNNPTKPSSTEPYYIQPSVNNTWKSHVLIVQRSLTELLKVPVIFICGGTLINQHTILTAADCIHKEIERNGKSYSLEVNESHFKVYLGVHNIEFVWDESKVREPSVQERKVSKIITHHLYDSRKKLNNIALFIFDKKIEQNEHIKTADLPRKGSDFPTHNKHACFVSGWGRTVEGRSNRLLSVKLETYEPRYCSELINYPHFDEKSQLCAGKFEGGENACEGFSGSGLYAFDKNHQNYVTFGILSYGYDCERENKPNIFTRTSYFIDWIHHHWMY